MYEAFTRQLFREAGLLSGMRVLDVGCGTGDVSIACGRTCWSNGGSSSGIDRAAAAIVRAKARAENQRMSNVQFVEGDPTLARFDDGFDAIVGRLLLMYYPDPIRCIANTPAHPRPVAWLLFRNSTRVAVNLIPPHRLTNVARIGSSGHYG